MFSTNKNYFIANAIYFTDFTGTASGLFQKSTNSIQIYSMYNASIRNDSQTFFNTSEIYFFDGSYDRAYIPIGIEYEDTSQLYERITQSNNTRSIIINHSFYNTYHNSMRLDVQNFNLYISIDSTSVYSGIIKNLQTNYYEVMSAN